MLRLEVVRLLLPIALFTVALAAPPQPHTAGSAHLAGAETESAGSASPHPCPSKRPIDPGLKIATIAPRPEDSSRKLAAAPQATLDPGRYREHASSSGEICAAASSAP